MNFHIYDSDDYKISSALNVWRQERHIDIKAQELGFMGNIAEELSELHRAQTIEDKIDALCDIMVFSINVIGNNYPLDNVLYNMSRCLTNNSVINTDKDAENRLICMLYKALSYTGSIKEKAFALVELSKDIIEFLGYDYVLCLNETIKEIFSRKGQWDDKIHKFVKYEGAYNLEEAKRIQFECKGAEYTHEEEGNWFFKIPNTGDVISVVQWYKANYLRCKKGAKE